MIYWATLHSFIWLRISPQRSALAFGCISQAVAVDILSVIARGNLIPDS